MKQFSITVTFVTALCLFTTPSWAGVLTGKVIHVADGDTITVRDSRDQKHKIRLYGIDCPESGQEYGKEATRHAARLADGREVRVVKYDKDRYGRIVGVVLVDGVNVNQSLIENGYAWKYRQYCKESFCSDWRRLEKQARKARTGLWADERPVPPWEWRRDQREGRSVAFNLFDWLGSATVVNRSYSGNVNSRVFHAPECDHYDCKNCRESFDDREQALRKGYKPCGLCEP